MASLFLENGAVLKDSGAIVAAAVAGNMYMVDVLLARGPDIDKIRIWHRRDRRYDGMMSQNHMERAWQTGTLLAEERNDCELESCEREDAVGRWLKQWKRKKLC